MVTPDRWQFDFAKLEIKDQVLPKILKDDAIRALRLPGEVVTAMATIDDLPGLVRKRLGLRTVVPAERRRDVGRAGRRRRGPAGAVMGPPLPEKRRHPGARRSHGTTSRP
jgi:hypothetical protein